jgi:hypothetical protein
MANSEPLDPRLLLLAPGDSVAVARRPIQAGEKLRLAGQEVILSASLGFGHKLAVKAMEPGEKIVKYGAPIGSASKAIALGEPVHVHNIKSDYLPNTVATP